MIPDPQIAKNTNKHPKDSAAVAPSSHANAYTAKIDHVLTSKQKLSGSFTWNHRDRYKQETAAGTFEPFPRTADSTRSSGRSWEGPPAAHRALLDHQAVAASTNSLWGTIVFQNKKQTSPITPNSLLSWESPESPDDCFPTDAFSLATILFRPFFGGRMQETSTRPKVTFIRGPHSVYLRGKT